MEAVSLLVPLPGLAAAVRAVTGLPPVVEWLLLIDLALGLLVTRPPPG